MSTHEMQVCVALRMAGLQLRYCPKRHGVRRRSRRYEDYTRYAAKVHATWAKEPFGEKRNLTTTYVQGVQERHALYAESRSNSQQLVLQIRAR